MSSSVAGVETVSVRWDGIVLSYPYVAIKALRHASTTPARVNENPSFVICATHAACISPK